MAMVRRLVNVAGPSDLYRPNLTAMGDEEGLGQWLEMAQGIIGGIQAKSAAKKQKAAEAAAAKKAKMQAKIDQAVAAKMAEKGGGAGAAGGFNLAGFGTLPILLIAGVLLGPMIAKAFRGR